MLQLKNNVALWDLREKRIIYAGVILVLEFLWLVKFFHVSKNLHYLYYETYMIVPPQTVENSIYEESGKMTVK